MAKVLHLPENTKGRDFVVGDIHGAFDLLDKALAKVNFDPEKDRLISIGDLIDRGPDSIRCLEFLKQPWFFALRGNHEDMFLDTYANGKIDQIKGAFNIRKGMGWIYDTSRDTLDELRDAFEKLPLAIEIPTARGTVGLVHADVPLGMDWKTFKHLLEQGDEWTTDTALWGRDRITLGDTRGVDGVGRVFFGHSMVEDGALVLGNCCYIDTGAVMRYLHGESVFPGYALTISDVTASTQTLARPVATSSDIQTKPAGPAKRPFKGGGR